MTTLRAGSATDVGQVRSNNQDSLFLVDGETLYGVADGMGGHQGGEVASAMAVELLGRHATERTLESLRHAVRVANRAIFEKAGNDRDLHGMGTTLVALRVVDGPDGDEVAWVNVGDSRVYLLRDDKLIQLSHDHSLVEDLLRDGQLTEDEAAVHPQRNILTRALGIDLDVQVDGATVLPFTGDRFLLCSDGLFNEVSSDQMASVLRRLAEPGEAASELVRLANEGGGRDNITVVVVDVVDDGGRSAAASALLADDPTRLVSPGPDADPSAVAPADGPSGEELFQGRRSSLPEATDDFGAEVDDPFGELAHARTRRITWRVVGFLVLLVVVLGVVAGAIGWSASNTYFVAFEGDQVAVFRGKPGGVLWFDPSLEDATEITRDEVPPARRPAIAAGKEFGSRSDADRFLVNLQAEVDDLVAATSTTTTSTSTTSTTAPVTTAPATTAPPVTAAPTTVP